MASQPIYQFYAELKDYEPKMWRRFQVPGNITMARLGYILMTMYEMRANHLFCLTVPVCENANWILHCPMPVLFCKMRSGGLRSTMRNCFRVKGKAPLMLHPIRCDLPSRVIRAKN